MPVHPGTLWLLENWEQLEDVQNQWVALTDDGVVDISEELEDLLIRLRDRGQPLEQYSVTFLSWDVIQ